MRDHEDAFGHELLDQLNGHLVYEIVERDDGYIDAHPAASYFAPYEEWPPSEQASMSHAKGRVLDIGCGAGRHALYLQETGFEVVAIDISPLAIEICRRRGVRGARLMSITEVSSSLGSFDTILMMGANFGLFANQRRANRLLRRFYRLTSPRARIVAQARDPYHTDNPFHVAYHKRNRERGRMGGALRIRVRYQKYTSPWFDYLFASHAEMEQLLDGTGWHVGTLLGADEPLYIAILTKT